AWDKVRIFARIEADTKNVSCPFDWNWASGERDTLIERGLLSALVFGQQGRVVQYFEVHSDEVAFRGAEDTLTPETAVFDVATNYSDSGGVTLTLSR
ncbi:MAG: hypothetical protein OEO19_16285, partial [Gammaproteobacteria bacterium]|nr:hypothetical protein [Gammaproteobacteria bacterium]